LVGAVGIELKTTLKACKLLIVLNEKNAKNTESAQVRYTPGTRPTARISPPVVPNKQQKHYLIDWPV